MKTLFFNLDDALHKLAFRWDEKKEGLVLGEDETPRLEDHLHVEGDSVPEERFRNSLIQPEVGKVGYVQIETGFLLPKTLDNGWYYESMIFQLNQPVELKRGLTPSSRIRIVRSGERITDARTYMTHQERQDYEIISDERRFLYFFKTRHLTFRETNLGDKIHTGAFLVPTYKEIVVDDKPRVTFIIDTKAGTMRVIDPYKIIKD